MKAVILAAGLGTRLRPFTCSVPKPLMPVWGVPMLQRIVDTMVELGVDDICINSHYLAEQIKSFAESIGAKVSYEKEILGTGGVLNPLRDWLGTEPFYLVNGDIVVENVPKFEIEEFKRNPETIALAVVSEEGPRTIEVEPESRFVTNWRSDDAGAEGTFTYCGFSLLKPEILDYVEPKGFSSIVTAYEKAMMQGKFVQAITSDALLWSDAGTISGYIELNRADDDNAFEYIPQIGEIMKVAGATGKVEFLSARGSNRVFFRCDKGIIVVYDDGERPENALYTGAARWLKAKNMPVPEIIADLPQFKTLLMADAGSERKMSLEEYVRVVEKLAEFNALGAAEDLPKLVDSFDESTWRWEHDLFERHCLGECLHREMPEAVREELKKVVEILEKEPKALVHRDFQSTNILWQGDKFTFIDFQGMRLGPAIYDLASLVYDPYVELSEGERRALIKLYAKAAGREEIAELLPFAAVQRLIQCLGAYGRLASVGQPQFLKYIKPAFVRLQDAAERVGLPAIAALAHENHCEHHHHHHHE